MMTMPEVLNHTPFFVEWTEDVHRLNAHDAHVMQMMRTIEGNCTTLETAITMLVSYKQYPVYEQTANFLLNDIKDFLMLDL